MSPISRLALPALAVIGAVIAQSSTCERDDTFVVQNSGDASSLGGGSCEGSYQGNIEISSEEDVVFDQLAKLDGDLIIKDNSKVQRISGSALQEISGKLEVNNVAELVGLAFPELTKVGSITLNGLPNLRGLEFGSEITECPKIDIQNTQLQDLNGINVKEAESIFIANNNFIGNITMSQLTNVTELLTLSFNNPSVNVSFPKLEMTKNATFRACGSIDLPALSEVGPGSLGFYDSENLDSVACPNLTTISQDLTINNNKQLTNISFPLLEKVGASLQIANNTELEEIDGFPELKEVHAAFDMSGNLSDVATPKLEFVKGVFNLQSTEDISKICSEFYDPKKSKLGPAPKYVCKGKLDEARTAGTGTSGSNGDKDSAAFSLHIQPAILGLAGLAAVMLV